MKKATLTIIDNYADVVFGNFSAQEAFGLYFSKREHTEAFIKLLEEEQ